MLVGETITTVLEPTANGGLGVTFEGREVVVDEADVRLHAPSPGERWRLEIGSQLRGNKWLAALVQIEQETSRKPPRHIGRGTTQKTREVFDSLPDCFELTFTEQDEFSVFANREGIPVRPSSFGPELRINTPYRVCPVATGKYGIRVLPAGLKSPSKLGRGKGQRFLSRRQIRKNGGFQEQNTSAVGIGSVFAAHFCEGDSRGIYASHEGYIVRPDRKWNPQPRKNSRYDVRVVERIIVRDKVLFVLPE